MNLKKTEKLVDFRKAVRRMAALRKKPRRPEYYLIDYENTGKDGLIGITSLRREDRVYLFHNNKNTIPASEVAALMKIRAKIVFKEAYTGQPNALDFQLSTLLGAMITSNPRRSYIIVSGDHGYDAVQKYWEAEKGVKIEIRACISGEAAQDRPLAEVVRKRRRGKSTRTVRTNHAPKVKVGKIQEPVTAGEPSKSRKVLTLSEEIEKMFGTEEGARIQEIISTSKDRQSLSNSLDKEYRDSKKASMIYNKLKPLLKGKL